MDKTKKKFDYSIILFLILPLLIFWLGNISVIFYNNDDFFLKQIASGEFTGTPEAHLLHIGYLTGLLLKGLYTLLPSVPWYGLLLFSYGYVSIMLSLHSVTKQIDKSRVRIAASLWMTFITVPFLWVHIIELQYTTITALVCAASLVQFYTAKENTSVRAYLTGNLPSIILFLLAVEIRDKACFMFLPTFFFIGLIKCVKNHKMFKPMLAYGGILLSLCILTWGINQIAYSSKEWSSFRTYNTARENIVDYNGYPNYEEYRAEYEALGVTYASYESAATRYQLLLDDNIDTDFMVHMEKLSHRFEPDIRQMLEDFLTRHITSYADRPLNLIVYVLYFFTILLIVCSKRWKAFFDVGALFTGRMIVWIYLLYIGRPMPRVTQGLYMTEFLLLLAILCTNGLLSLDISRAMDAKNKKSETRKKSKNFLYNTVFILFLTVAVFTCIKWGLPNFKTITEHSKSRSDFSVAYTEIHDYFNTHDDNLYLLDTNSFSYFTENILTKSPESAANTILLGSWTANSPWTDSIAARYDITSYEEAAVTRDNVYFVFMNAQATDYAYLEEYFQSRYPHTSMKVCDTFTTTNGLEFQILQVKTN